MEDVRADLPRLAAPETQVPYDREFVTPFERSRARRFRVEQPPTPRAVSRRDLSLTVDTASDRSFVRLALESACFDSRVPRFTANIAAVGRINVREEAR